MNAKERLEQLREYHLDLLSGAVSWACHQVSDERLELEVENESLQSRVTELEKRNEWLEGALDKATNQAVLGALRGGSK